MTFCFILPCPCNMRLTRDSTLYVGGDLYKCLLLTVRHSYISPCDLYIWATLGCQRLYMTLCMLVNGERMPIKDVKMVVFLKDVNGLNMTEDELQALNLRLETFYSYGTNFKNVVTIYPRTIAIGMKTEDKIIAKFNYTVTHELIHGLLEDVALNTENICHALTMILTEDVKSNVSGQGYRVYDDLKGKIEIEVTQTEAETPKAPLSMAQLTKANRNLSRERLRKFHETIG